MPTLSDMFGKVTKLALASRLIVFIIQFIANLVLTDHQPDVFRTPATLNEQTLLDKIVKVLFGGLRHWDGEYFLHIAEHLYSYENTLAFYPLYPLLVRLLTKPLFIFDIPMSEHNHYLIIAVALNTVLFCKAANVLYQLTQRVFNDLNKSWYAALLFCFNPGAIFFSAAYSETLFALTSFYVMLCSVTELRFVSTSMSLACSFLTRSNGLINAGFPIYFYVRQMVLPPHRYNQIIKMIGSLIVSILPLSFFYFYVYQQFCLSETPIKHTKDVIKYGLQRNYVIAGFWHTNMEQEGQSPWCNETLPFPYSYIQSHYWNVGFFKYYEWKQLPNFLIATPIIIYLQYQCISYLKDFVTNIRPKYNFNELLKEYKSLPFVLHAWVLTTFCCLYVHIQVSTRLVAAATPCLYWFAADVMPKTFAELKMRSKAGLILTWFSSYFVIGTIMFSNNYPWT